MPSVNNGKLVARESRAGDASEYYSKWTVNMIGERLVLLYCCDEKYKLMDNLPFGEGLCCVGRVLGFATV